MIYRFRDTAELKDLTLDVRASAGRLSFKARGTAPRRVLPSVHAYFAWLNSLHHVRVRGDSYVYSLYVPPVPSTAHAYQLENFLRNRLFGRRTPMAATLAVTTILRNAASPRASPTIRRNRLPPNTAMHAA